MNCRSCKAPTKSKSHSHCPACHRAAFANRKANEAAATELTIAPIEATIRHANILGIPVYRTTAGELPIRAN